MIQQRRQKVMEEKEKKQQEMAERKMQMDMMNHMCAALDQTKSANNNLRINAENIIKQVSPLIKQLPLLLDK